MEPKGMDNRVSQERGRSEVEALRHDLAQILEEFFRGGGTFSDAPEAVEAAVAAVRAKVTEQDYFTPIEFSYLKKGEKVTEAHETAYEELMEWYAGYVYPETYRHKRPEDALTAEEVAKRNQLRRILDMLERDPRFTPFAQKKERDTYGQYLNNLGLAEENLQNKKRILDIGAGARLFASYCIRHRINPEVYSLDPYIETPDEEGYQRALWPPEVQREIDQRTVRAGQEHLPFENRSFDLVLIHGAMPLTPRSTAPEEISFYREEVQHTLSEIARVLMPGGEARLAGISDPQGDPTQKVARKIMDAELARLRAQKEYAVKVERISGPPEQERTTYRIVIKRKAAGKR